MDQERIDDLIALAALGELTSDESAELDALAAAAPEVAVELAAALDAAAALQTAELDAPPEHLRQAVLDAVAEQPSPAGVRDLSAMRMSRRAKLTRRLLPIAAAVVLSVGVGVVIVQNSGDDPAAQIAAVLEAPDRKDRTLAGDLLGSVEVAVSPAEKALVVEAKGLVVLTEAETYQLWIVRGDDAESVGTFRPRKDGTVTKRFDDVRPGDGIVAVTLEPAGGSKKPTPPILASA